MLAKELIVEDLPTVSPSDRADLALSWMDEFKVLHLAVAEHNNFLGIVSEGDLLDLSDVDGEVNQCRNQFIPVSVTADQHVFDVVKSVSEQNLSVIPVLNDQGDYLGSTSISHLMSVIADMPVVKNPGGIIVLEVNVNDYVLSEIARIVENNDAKILGTFITRHPDSTKMELTLKINRMDLGAILQTFDRFDYTVTASYDQGDTYEDLKSRYDSLMNYLNM